MTTEKHREVLQAILLCSGREHSSSVEKVLELIRTYGFHALDDESDASLAQLFAELEDWGLVESSGQSKLRLTEKGRKHEWPTPEEEFVVACFCDTMYSNTGGLARIKSVADLVKKRFSPLFYSLDSIIESLVSKGYFRLVQWGGDDAISCCKPQSYHLLLPNFYRYEIVKCSK